MSEFILGVDIGGTSIRFCIYNVAQDCVEGSLVKRTFIHLEHAAAEVEANLFQPIDQIVQSYETAGIRLRAIGVSSAALFDRKHGVITVWPNNPLWNGFPLRTCLEQRYHVNVYMEDDSNCAALGEQWKGRGARLHSFIYITLSTGISCGIITDDQLYPGKHGWAGEIGHIAMLENGPTCVCGKKGCLQALASGPAIVSAYCEQSGIDPALISLEELAKRASANDIAALEAFRKAGHYVARMIEILVAVLDIDSIVIGGGVLKAGEFYKAILEEATDNLLGNTRKVDILFSELQDLNGIYGAVKLCMDKDININHYQD
ncbi:ROK family protein [Paenibacillus tepidiphilus]|uniref:ROK family protein n=1 Tax=Paenibacillus tepidiphilus TaxID=2608683 RepID=UPI001239EC14|nr:ROK family protein [Paenibacillus tepidiphilus]